MAKVKHTLTIEFELEDLSPEDRIELYEGIGMQGDPDDPENGLPTVHDVSIHDLFDAVSLAVETSDDMWAGTECYCKINSISTKINGTVFTNKLNDNDHW